MVLLGFDLIFLGITITAWDAFDEGESMRTIKELETLRQTADVLPRRASRGLEAGEIDEEEFTRLTRRALSNLGDLPKLATSPLVHLPIIEGTNPLDRAHALRAMLVQSIQKLNPKYPLGKNQMITISQ